MNLLKHPALLASWAALLALAPLVAEPSGAPAEPPAPAPAAGAPAAPPAPAPPAGAPAAPPAPAVPVEAPVKRPPPPPPFVMPAEGPVAFRRDRLLLDVDTMMALSHQFGALAQALGGETPQHRRTAAQMLALALALQPGNVEVRRVLEKFSKSELKPAAADERLDAARARIWQIFGWLESPAAGHDGQALAACLGDVMALADPRHPRAEDLRKKGEQGAWAGWVQPLDAFSKTESVANHGSAGTTPPKVPTDDPAFKNPILLATAVVTTPLWTLDKASGALVLRPVPVRMQAKLKEGYAQNEPMSCALAYSNPSATGDPNPFRLTSAAVVKALAKEHGKVPDGVAVSLICGTNADYLIDRNRNAIAGAAAVLMNAALTGSEPDATIIGEVQADGSFKLPPRFWDKLRALSNGPGGRLVLPQEAESFLPAILALEDPGFFFKYEVLFASNLQQLIERSAKTSPPALAALTAKFVEVRSKLGAQSLTAYVANRFVRQRLEEIARAASCHASARLLAIQGAGKRPALLSRSILANELRRAIQPMAWIPSHPVETLQTKSLNETFENCLREVDRLERYAEMRDRPLHVQVRELVLAVRTLSRSMRGRYYDAKTFFVPWRADFDAFVRTYQTVIKGLAVIAADG